MDGLQFMGINQDALGAVQVILEGVNQFKGRTAVKIALQANVQIINRAFDADFKILGHLSSPARREVFAFPFELDSSGAIDGLEKERNAVQPALTVFTHC